MVHSGLVIVGAGGHAKVVAEVVRQSKEFSVVGYLDDLNADRRGMAFCGSTILGGSELLPQLMSSGTRHAFVAVGDCESRLRHAERLRDMGFVLPVLRHPSAVSAHDVVIGMGTLLNAGVIVGPASSIGAAVIVNTAASVDHDCHIEDGVHIGPGARLGGRVTVGRMVWLGIGAVVRDGIRIANGAVVGAGAVVVKDVPENAVVYGNPARFVRWISGAEAAL